MEVGEKFEMPDAATAVTDSVRIFIPMDELIDKDKELARLKKEQEKVQKDLDFLSKKLSNQGFLAKAPEKAGRGRKKGKAGKGTGEDGQDHAVYGGFAVITEQGRTSERRTGE